MSITFFIIQRLLATLSESLYYWSKFVGNYKIKSKAYNIRNETDKI